MALAFIRVLLIRVYPFSPSELLEKMWMLTKGTRNHPKETSFGPTWVYTARIIRCNKRVRV